MKKRFLLRVCWIGIFYLSSAYLLGQSSTDLPPRVSNITVLDPLSYPGKAIRKGIEGAVKIEIEVNETGEYVAHNIVESAHDILSERVDPFMSQLTFHPATKGQEEVSGLAVLEIRFRIERKVPPKTEIAIKFLKPD